MTAQPLPTHRPTSAPCCTRTQPYLAPSTCALSLLLRSLNQSTCKLQMPQVSQAAQERALRDERFLDTFNGTSRD